jgi:hypothetical protein
MGNPEKGKEWVKKIHFERECLSKILMILPKWILGNGGAPGASVPVLSVGVPEAVSPLAAAPGPAAGPSPGPAPAPAPVFPEVVEPRLSVEWKPTNSEPKKEFEREKSEISSTMEPSELPCHLFTLIGVKGAS